MQASYMLSITPWDSNGAIFKPKVQVEVKNSMLHLHWSIDQDYPFAQAREINGEVYLDRCCEFFWKPSSQSNYYLNLEVNCLGVPHLAFGPNRLERKFIDPSFLKRQSFNSSLLSNHSSLKSIDLSQKTDWELDITINLNELAEQIELPIDPQNWQGNFYFCGGRIQAQHLTTFLIKTEKADFHRPEFFKPLW